MGDLTLQLPGGQELGFLQALELGRLLDLAGPGRAHWHPNECGCCVTLHGPDYAYVVGRDGSSTFYANRGCSCRQ